VKIDRSKLNTLLRSGLNPEIKTRKQLAAHLSLDPTSITRWFATRDRLGNPRYPVVPDRHVTKLLQLFNLSAQSLELSDEEFRQHCFEMSLQQVKNHDDLEQKNTLRLKSASQRAIAINEYTTTKSSKVPFIFVVILIFIGFGWFILSIDLQTYMRPPPIIKQTVSDKKHCWVGYSPSLGRFDKEDKADPCHYRKLLQNAVAQLKAINESAQTSKTAGEFSATQEYILFLSEQLEQRSINNKVIVNIELGKSELHRLNYQKAQEYFQIASDTLLTSLTPDPQVVAELATLKNQLNNK